MSQKEGIFLVRLGGPDREDGKMDHVVCVHVDIRRVCDSVEKYAIVLKKEVLDVCVGDGFQLLVESVVKRFTCQKVGKGRSRYTSPAKKISKKQE